jgi:prepilin-type N-terminal cleavage/methylation domain-containing protein
MSFMKNNRKAFSLVEILIVVAVIALLAAIAIPNLMRAKLNSNQASAQATLKAIANALETYAISNGIYPTQTTSLIGAAPPYLNKDYFATSFNGYNFSALITDYAYLVTAEPASSSSGTLSYSITTGGVLTTN